LIRRSTLLLHLSALFVGLAAASPSLGLGSHADASLSAATVFAVGDVADCRAKNPSLMPTTFLDRDELAEHRVGSGTWLPQEPLRIEELIENHPGVVLGLGDLAYPAGTLEQYRECFEKVWGPAVLRTYPVFGNHDAMSGGTGYRQFWGATAGASGNYYSFDYGSWHLVALNSEIDSAPGSEQWLFLERDLKTARTRCILAFFHRPAYASLYRSHGEHAQELFRLLDRHKVTLALNGHNHYYERTSPLDGDGNVTVDGVREFIVGTGGKQERYGPITPAAFTEKLIIDQSGVLRLDLHKDSYKWQFITAASGQVLDQGKGLCRGN
jgi:hypothetical protein